MKKLIFVIIALSLVTLANAQSYWNSEYARIKVPILQGDYNPNDSIPKDYMDCALYQDTVTRKLWRLNAGKNQFEVMNAEDMELIIFNSNGEQVVLEKELAIVRTNAKTGGVIRIPDNGTYKSGVITIMRDFNNSEEALSIETMSQIASIESLDRTATASFTFPADVYSITFVFDSENSLWRIKSVYKYLASSGGVTDSDKGDITVSGGGTTWTIDAGAVTFAKMQNIATSRLIGRTDAGTGPAAEITIGTGLTGVTATGSLVANLSVGVENGQSAIGGTRASENLTLSSTYNATKGKILFGNSAYDEANQRLGIGTQSPTSAIHFVLPTNLSGTQNAMYLSSAFDATATGTRSFIQYDLTTAGSSGNTYGLTLNLLPGQTGTASTQGIRVINTSTTSPAFNIVSGTSNSGAAISASGVNGGNNVGASINASNALVNIGNRSRATGGSTENSINIGVLGVGTIGTSTGTPYQIGGYFSTETATPTIAASAGLMCDNGTATNDIFVARDNGNPVFTIADGGNVNSTGSITVADAAYSASWDASNAVPTRNAVYDKIESLGSSSSSVGFSKDSVSSAQWLTGFRNKIMVSPAGMSVLLMGDSRVEQKMWGNAFKRKLIRLFGNGGIGLFINWDYYPLGITNANNATGGAYTAVNNTGDGLYSLYGKSITISTTNSANGPVFVETSADTLGEVRWLDVYYLQKTSGGNLRVRIMDKTSLTVYNDVTISTTGTNNVTGKTTIDLGQVRNNLRFEYTCISGGSNIITLLPCRYRRNTTGVIVDQCGQGSRTTAEFNSYNTTNGTYWAGQLKPNLMIYNLAINDGTASVAPGTMRTNALNTINTYRSATGANYFSALLLGETGTRIAEEYEDRINSAYYLASITGSSSYRTYIGFTNPKDIIPDWATMMAIPSWAWTTSDNIHWGTRGGIVWSDYIWRKIFSSSGENMNLFPRKYNKIGLSAASYDVAANAPTNGTNLYVGEIADYVTVSPNKVRVVVNGIERTYNAAATAFGWSYTGDTITAYDTNAAAETIKTISVEIFK